MLLRLFCLVFCVVQLTQSAEASLLCYVQGECPLASLLPPTKAESYNECLANCQGDEECQWFTFYAEAQLCQPLVSCPDGPTAECQQEPCFSSEAKCQQLLQCDVKSLWCKDPQVGYFVSVDDLQECKDRCSEEKLCQWYNFDASTQACLLTSSCKESTTTCATCIAGQKECLNAAADEMNTLMVVGGFPDDPNAVEVIDLSGKFLTCPQLKAGPFDEKAVGTFANGAATVCAGQNLPTLCYTFNNENNGWNLLTDSLVYDDFSRGGVLLSDGRWWLAGGYNVTGYKVETEVVYPEQLGSSEPFAALPRKAFSPIMVQLNESTVVFVGGWEVHDDLWLFNLDTNEWTELPNMPLARLGPGAGLATFPDGSRQLVVTGGEYKSTHVFNFETNIWRLIPGRLPFKLFPASSVQFKDTFLLVGGSAESTYVNTILEFDPKNEAWIVRKETLATGKYYSTAFLVPDDYVKCV